MSVPPCVLPASGQQLSVGLTCWKVTKLPSSLRGLGLLQGLGLFLEAV